MEDPFDGRTGPPAPATRIHPRSLELSFTQAADGRTGSARSHAERRTPQWRELLTEWRAPEASHGRRKARMEGSGHTRRMAATEDAASWRPAPVLAAAPQSIRLRQLALLALLTTVAMTPFARVARAALGVYVSLICFATIRAKGGWRIAPVLAALHLTWSTRVVVALACAARGRLMRPPRPTDS